MVFSERHKPCSSKILENATFLTNHSFQTRILRNYSFDFSHQCPNRRVQICSIRFSCTDFDPCFRIRTVPFFQKLQYFRFNSLCEFMFLPNYGFCFFQQDLSCEASDVCRSFQKKNCLFWSLHRNPDNPKTPKSSGKLDSLI